MIWCCVDANSPVGKLRSLCGLMKTLASILIFQSASSRRHQAHKQVLPGQMEPTLMVRRRIEKMSHSKEPHSGLQKDLGVWSRLSSPGPRK